MTFNECKAMLENIKERKRIIRSIRREIEDIDKDIEALSLRSTLGNSGLGHGSEISRPVERIVLRLRERQADFEKQLDLIMELEDKVAQAIKELPDDEQDVIISYYMSDDCMYSVANKVHLSESTAYRKKKRAIGKIARKIIDTKN